MGAPSVVTSRRVQGPLSITGNELVRRGRRERETQKERKRLESSHFHFCCERACAHTPLGSGEAVLASRRLIWSGIGSEFFTKSAQILSQPVITARKEIINQGWLKIAHSPPTSGAEIGAASQTDAEFVTPWG